METITRHFCKHKLTNPFKSILYHHFFYSTLTQTPTNRTSPEPYSLSNLKNFLVNSIGFSDKQALSTSTKLSELRSTRGASNSVVNQSSFLKNADSVVNFLQNKGFTKPQIKKLVCSVPQILCVRIEQNFEPKLKFFREMGLSCNDFVDVVVNQPPILGFGLNSTICPAVEALREVLGSEEDVVKALKRFRFYDLSLVNKHLVSNVSFLQSQGIPIEPIRMHLLNRSACLFLKREELKDFMNQAHEKWGISLLSPVFLSAVNLICNFSEETIKSKLRMFERFGWDRADVLDLFRRNPNCLAVSESKIKAVLSLFMEELGFDKDYIVAHPFLISYSFEKRIMPRHLVLQILKEKQLLRRDHSLYSALLYSDLKFLDRFVRPFEGDVPSLRDIYAKRVGSSVVKKQLELKDPIEA